MFRLPWGHSRSRTGRVFAGGPFLFLIAACTSIPPPIGTFSPAPVGASGSAPAIASTSAEAASSAVRGTFTSGLYDYDVALPIDWARTPASSRWLSGELEGQCPSDWDCFTDLSDHRTLAVAAIQVPGDLTLDEWRIRIHQSQPDVCSDTGTTSPTTLGGDPAESWAVACPSEGLKTIKTVAIHSRKGYVLIFASPSEDSLDADSSAFAALLETFRFAA